MNSKSSSAVVRCVRMLASIFLIVLVSLQAVPQVGFNVSASDANAPEVLAPYLAAGPISQTSPCYPGSGWTWTYGPELPDLTAAGLQALTQAGFEVTVEARAFGETDSCGTFVLQAVDFSVTVRDPESNSAAQQQALTDRILSVLDKLASPKLGKVQVTFFPSNKVIIRQAEVPVAAELWQQVTTTTSPSGRYTHGLAYDSYRDVSLLFGGDDTGSARLNDTWQFDGVDWTQLSPALSPPGRANIDQTLVYDSSRHRVVLFGGLGASGYLGDTWEFDGTTWSEVNGSPSPESRDSHGMAFDAGRGVTVLFGGYGSSGVRLNDTWEYDGQWHSVSTPQKPSGRSHHALAYDERRHVVVLFGGATGPTSFLADTWEYDGTTWHQVIPAQSPTARINHSMTYDSARGVVVLFGGLESPGLGAVNDTWEYDGTTWTHVTTGLSPAPRTEMSLAFDHVQSKVLFFGGGYWDGGDLTTFEDTWEYSGPASPPEPGLLERKVYVIVYDPILTNGQYLSDYLGWLDHEDLTQGTIDFFLQASHDQVHYSVVDTTVVTDGWPEKIDGFRYTEDEYLAMIRGEIPPHQPDNVNYNAIVNSPAFDICGKANSGTIDEVWIYNGPGFGFYESTLVGPDAYWFNSPPVPGPYTCNRLIPIMGPSPERGLDCATENFGHRTESTMTQVYGSWQQNRTSHNWERFALVKALSPDYFYSGCGNIHYPPNGESDYDYGNTSTVLSNCDDFANYPDLGDPAQTALPVSCPAWDCDHLEYFNYWYSHFPHNSGCGPDDVANDWWYYFASPELALHPLSACLTEDTFLPLIVR